MDVGATGSLTDAGVKHTDLMPSKHTGRKDKWRLRLSRWKLFPREFSHPKGELSGKMEELLGPSPFPCNL